MNPIEISTQEVDDLLPAGIQLEVMGVDGRVLSAVIWPTELSARAVCGVVAWEGSQIFSSLVCGVGDTSVWAQHFRLIWLAAGPQLAPKLPGLGAHRWQLCTVVMQDVDGGGDTVRISVNRQSCLATLALTREGGVPATLAVPLELQDLEVGSVLAEMASQLLLQRSWLDLPRTA